MENTWWFLGGIIGGVFFTLYGVLPFFIIKFVVDNEGTTFEETVDDVTYEIEIRRK